jgi:hypothetical protein
VVFRYANTFELKTMFFDKRINKLLQFFANDHNVINIDKELFLMCNAIMHPHNWIWLARYEAQEVHDIGKAVMPTCNRGTEAIEGTHNG